MKPYHQFIYRMTTDFCTGQDTYLIVCDQPLYTKLKELQLTSPEKYKRFLFMLGPLHIELVMYYVYSS